MAAFLDRVDRARASEAAHEDLRYLAFRDAVGILAGGDDDRARRVHLCFTDPTTEPLASAAGLKGAAGAWMGGRP